MTPTHVGKVVEEDTLEADAVEGDTIEGEAGEPLVVGHSGETEAQRSARADTPTEEIDVVIVADEPADAAGPRKPNRAAWWRRSTVGVLAFAIAIGTLAALMGEPRDATVPVPAAAAPSPGRDEGSDVSSPPAPATDALPAPPVVEDHVGFFAHTDVDGRFDVVALIGRRGDRAEIVLVAPPTLVEVPSMGLVTIADLGTIADPVLVPATIENTFGIDIDTFTVLGDAALVAAMSPAGTIQVDLHRPVRIDDERGTLSLPAGPQTILAADAMRLMTADPGEGALDRLVVGQAVLDGWLDAVASGDHAAAMTAADDRLSTLTAAADVDRHFTSLPVLRFSASVDDELYGLDRDEVRAAMVEAFDWALLADRGERVRVELLNGTGAVGVTGLVASQIVPAGGEVVLTGNVPGFGIDDTVVVYYREADRGAAEHLLTVLGTGSLAIADQPLGVVDVTVIIGSDLPGAEPPPPDPDADPGVPIEELEELNG